MPRGGRVSYSLRGELARRGVVLDDLTAFWEAARDCGTLPSGVRPVYEVLTARYTAEGTPYHIYEEIAGEWGVCKQAVRQAFDRALSTLAQPRYVVRYGHYLDVATIDVQPELLAEAE